VKPGIIYTTFHFPEHLVNNVTSDEHCADTMCPEYKVSAVNFEKIYDEPGKAGVAKAAVEAVLVK